MNKRPFVLVDSEARSRAIQCVRDAPVGYCVVVSEPTRSLSQNAALWPLLACLAKQVEWHGQRLSADDWKTMLTASLRRQRAAPGIDGGFVVFGEHTSTYTKSQFSELLELCHAFGAQHGVDFNHH